MQSPSQPLHMILENLLITGIDQYKSSGLFWSPPQVYILVTPATPAPVPSEIFLFLPFHTN